MDNAIILSSINIQVILIIITMQMYDENDLSDFIDNFDNIKKQLQKNQFKYLVPSYDFLKNIEDIIFKYIRDNKRKIYGGYAQNKLIIQKNPKDKFYKDEEIADIDFYSPDPVQDILNLTNMFYELKFENVSGGEAQHPETYTIFVEFEKVCDISYVPANVYNRIPFVEIDGIYYCNPQFMMIDLYRSFTDPLNSGMLRWEKTFPRILTLQKHYPYPQVSKKIPLPYEPNKTAREMILNILQLLKNKDSTIIFGSYVYNCYINETKINKENKLFNYLDMSFLELISNDYINDAKAIYNDLTNGFAQEVTNLSVTEFHRFWILNGYSCIIYYNKVPLCRIIDYNNVCVPVKQIPFTIFEGDKAIQDSKNTIQIAAFDYNFVQCMISAFKCRVDKNEEWYAYYNIMISHLVYLRKYFIKKSGKNMFDDTIFQQFITSCVGKTISSVRAVRLEIMKRKAKHKMLVWKYSPETDPKKTESNFHYRNSSGNPITNPAKLKVFKK